MNLYRSVAISDHRLARLARRLHRKVINLSIPAPKLIFTPLLWIVLAARETWYFIYRVFFCEPLFKAYCRQVGMNLHTDASLHWVRGKGDIVIGDNVTVDGKCYFLFAARFSGAPTLTIGDNAGIGHGCQFTVGKRIAIGKYCRIGSSVVMFDSPGHPLDPGKRLAGLPPAPEDVRPITIGNNVWIGSGAIIFPGVSIGDNSVVAPASLVMSDVSPDVVVAGSPARKMLAINPGSQSLP
jgi:carbonic anhydrase/acetyltransferase-like protein (isoleucine patch superfamily)